MTYATKFANGIHPLTGEPQDKFTGRLLRRINVRARGVSLVPETKRLILDVLSRTDAMAKLPLQQQLKATRYLIATAIDALVEEGEIVEVWIPGVSYVRYTLKENSNGVC